MPPRRTRKPPRTVRNIALLLPHPSKPTENYPPVPIAATARERIPRSILCIDSRDVMLNLFPSDVTDPAHAIWVDLYDPTAEEIQKVEKALSLDIPERKELEEIESS